MQKTSLHIESMNQSFPKEQRLCSLKQTEALFAGSGVSISAFPIRAVFITDSKESKNPVSDSTELLTTKSVSACRILVSVGKRKFKHAVDRNRAKRQVREAWRLNRDILLSEIGESKGLSIAFIWLAAEPQPSSLVHRKMKNILYRIVEHIKGQSSISSTCSE